MGWKNKPIKTEVTAMIKNWREWSKERSRENDVMRMKHGNEKEKVTMEGKRREGYEENEVMRVGAHD